MARNVPMKAEPPLALVPYHLLTEEEKNFDRRTAMETLRLIIALGYEIKRRE